MDNSFPPQRWWSRSWAALWPSPSPWPPWRYEYSCTRRCGSRGTLCLLSCCTASPLVSFTPIWSPSPAMYPLPAPWPQCRALSRQPSLRVSVTMFSSLFFLCQCRAIGIPSPTCSVSWDNICRGFFFFIWVIHVWWCGCLKTAGHSC